MTTICKNCNNRFEGNFCNHCGQAADTHKVNMHFIWHDVLHGLFHFDKGIFYTIKQLLTRPGITIREFIDGKRVRHFKPLSLVVVLATLYGLCYHFFIHNLYEVSTINSNENVINVYGKITKWMTDHFAYASLIMILTSTIVSYFVFKKQGRNFAEHLILNTFYTGLTLVVSFLLLPVHYLYSNEAILKWFAFISILINFVLMCWCYVQFFNKIPKIKSLILTLLAYLIMSGTNILIGYFIGWVISSIG
jgi:hypothetical protein